jgi:RNA polymerase sigma-70 factor (ECF subfamily)
MDELEAVLASQAGDRAAFGALIDSYYKSIYRFAFQCTGSHQDADDICQETFLRALDRIKQLKDAKCFKGWIFMIASNLSRKRSKQAGHKKIASDILLEQSAGDYTQPFESLSGKEKTAELHKRLQEMPEQMRMVIVLVLMEELPQKQVARILNCSEPTISRELNSAKNWLRNKCKDFI